MTDPIWTKAMATFEFGHHKNGEPFVEVFVFGSKKLFDLLHQHGGNMISTDTSIKALVERSTRLTVTRKKAAYKTSYRDFKK